MYYLHRPQFFSHPGYPWYYPAAGVFPLQFFYWIGRASGDWLNGYLGYISMAVLGAGFAATILARTMRRYGVDTASAFIFTFLTALFSWPIYFSLQRGNIESVTWLLVAAAIWAYGKERWFAAAVLLGVVAAFKFYPGLCFALFLRPRRWKELATGIATMFLVTVAALRYILPDVFAALHGVATGMASWINDYARSYGPASATYDHSLYEIVKVLTRNLHPDYGSFVERYTLCIAVIALLLFFGRVIRLPRTNQVVFLVTASVFLPPASFDYTLQNLYVAFGWLVLAGLTAREQGRSMGAIAWILVLLAFIFGPETFILWNDMTAAGLLKGFVLLVVLAISIGVPMEDIKPRGLFYTELI